MTADSARSVYGDAALDTAPRATRSLTLIYGALAYVWAGLQP